MKVQLFTSSALLLLSAIPGTLSAKVEHRHLKEGDFEEKKKSLRAPARSISFRGAAAAAAFAAAAEDASASDKDEEIIQEGWKEWTKGKWSNDPNTGKPWGHGWSSKDWEKNPNTGKPWGHGWSSKDWEKNPNTGKPWGYGWSSEDWGKNPNTGKPWGAGYGWHSGDHCSTVWQKERVCGNTWGCSWKKGKCVPDMSQDED